jgi:hypothetical protein
MRGVVIAALLACVATTAIAAMGSPAELMDVRRALAAAVASHDVSGAAALIRFPVDGTSIEEAEFLRDPLQFRKLFDRGQSWIVNCLESGRAEKQDSPDFSAAPWRVECSGRTYYFGQFSGRWRLAGYSD